MRDKAKNQFLNAYDAYADALYRHCFFRIFSQSRAEELVQEAFVRVWQYLESGKEIQNIRPFLYQTASNLIVDDARKKKEESLEKLMEESNSFEPSYSGHKDIEQDVTLKEILYAMKMLDEEERQLLTMRYVDDLDPKEIAAILGITANNVSVRMNRAVKNLKAKFNLS